MVQGPLRWLWILASAGMLLGAVLGLGVALGSDCHIDGDGTLPAGACVRVLGMYFSALTTYVATGALVGAGLGLALGAFVVAPIPLWRRQDRVTRMHPLEHPVIWFGLQLLELVVLIPACSSGSPIRACGRKESGSRSGSWRWLASPR